jgi:transcriptional antiterminator NusG
MVTAPDGTAIMSENDAANDNSSESMAPGEGVPESVPVDGPADSPAADGAEAVSPPSESAVPAAPEVPDNKRWYVVKVQSNREDSIKEAIIRRIKIEGLQDNFGEILIPTEKYTEVNRNNKRVTKERKLFPGYIMVNLEFNEHMLYLFRETSGVGDFVGGGLNKPPQPMTQKEVDRMLKKQGHDVPISEAPSKFNKGDKVKVKDGTFAGMEGEVKEVLETKGAIRVALTIFGREVPVELEYWQVDYAD